MPTDPDARPEGVEAERLRSAYSRWAASLVDDAKREGREARADEFTPWAAFQAGAALSAEASATRAERLEAENEALRGALHDAIRRPLGVVPDSAAPYYHPESNR
ncbi:MAG TPA: hypothetical protein VFI96_06240 [Longimicrobiaceae bacterium]|nr:hypothetical protein [Longimicrobiaceae bacterium]